MDWLEQWQKVPGAPSWGQAVLFLKDGIPYTGIVDRWAGFVDPPACILRMPNDGSWPHWIYRVTDDKKYIEVVTGRDFMIMWGGMFRYCVENGFFTSSTWPG